MKEFFQSFNLLSEKELDYIEEKIYVKELEKGDFIIKEGEINNEIVWIKEGIIRSFYTTEKGDEFTYCIIFKNTIMTALSSYISGEPSLENIQAITPVNLEVIKAIDLKYLTQKSISCMTLEKLLIEQQYIELEKRIFSFQKEKASERYLDLINKHPEYIQQIPLHYLASYLGISLRHLTRIRKKFL